MADDGRGRECEVVLTKAADGTVTAEWAGRGPGGWVRCSCEAIDELVHQANERVLERVSLHAAYNGMEELAGRLAEALRDAPDDIWQLHGEFCVSTDNCDCAERAAAITALLAEWDAQRGQP